VDCSDTFDIQCLTGSGRERFSFRPGSGFSAPIAALPAARKKEDILEICRDAANMTRQRL
jgi:hypothetical protein